MAKSFEEYCKSNAIQHIATATATPRANGQVEHVNRTLLDMLRTKVLERQESWDVELRVIQWAMNHLAHSVTKVSPHSLLLTCKPRSILKNKLILCLNDNERKEPESTNQKVDELNRLVESRLKDASVKQKEYFDRKHKPPITYEVGDMVLLKSSGGVSTGTSRKLMERYKGPYLVKEVLPNDRYIVTDIEGAEQSQRKFVGVYASDRMKRWCSLEDLEGLDSGVDGDIYIVRMDDCNANSTRHANGLTKC